MKYLNHILLTILMSMVGVKAYAYDIKVKNADGVTIYYVWNHNKTELAVSNSANKVVSYPNIYNSYPNDYTGNVVIPESVTYSGKTYSVTSIDASAFVACTGLTSVTIPNSVIVIYSYAFYNCTGLTSINIPNSVKTIYNHTFYGCTGLTSINIPNSVTFIYEYAFNNTGWYNAQSDGILYLDNWLIGYKGSKPTGEIAIKSGTKGLADEAFYECTELTSVTIPNSVTFIGHQAFYNTNLMSITIGSGVLSMGYGTFSNKPIKVIWLTNTPPKGYQDAAGTVNYVANDSYGNLNNKTVYPFLSSLFEVDGVKYVPVSPSERTCDAIDCSYNESIEKINIKNTVSYKGVQMTVKNVKQYVCYGNSFIKDVDLSFDGVLSDYAFQNCTAMKTATLGDGITSIGQSAFDGCKQLENIVIPNTVTSLGRCAFNDCTSMTSAKIGIGVTTINPYVFSNCSALPNIEIPQSVEKIENYVFRGCKSLKEVIMAERNADDTALTLGSNGSSPLFADCPLNSVYIGRNISYSTSSSYGYSPFYRNTSLCSVTITDKETEISPNEFYGCTNLKNVSIGNGVETIGDWAFSGCSSLDYFAFGSSVKTIGKEAFSDCTAMTRLISHSTTPPSCGSQALDDINKWNCTLSVPTGSTSYYQQASQWKDFFFIDNNISGISKLMNTKAAPTYFYDLNGQKIQNKKTGLNIIRMKDGTTKKVILK